MKNTLFLIGLIFFAVTSCSKVDTLVGTWKGKNNDGVDLKWTFSPDGTASSMKGNGAIQEMKYTVDDTQKPRHINLNSLVDAGTLQAIYKFTDTGKLIIGMSLDVTIRPENFSTPNLQLLILTKE